MKKEKKDKLDEAKKKKEREDEIRKSYNKWLSSKRRSSTSLLKISEPSYSMSMPYYRGFNNSSCGRNFPRPISVLTPD